MAAQAGRAIGIDFGGSGIKGALVDLDSGELIGERERIETPADSGPAEVAEVIAELVGRFDDATCPVGITVPGVIHHGRVRSAGNIDRAWIGVDADALLTERLRRDVHVLNDADAAGLAEVTYGVARGRRDFVIVTTLGTGIGSAFLYDGVLIPNTELGHLEIDGHVAEHKAANSAREREELSWEEWAERLTRFYQVVDRLFTPDLFVVGGGVSKKADRFLPLVECECELVPALLLNRAGIVGAALWALQGAAAEAAARS